jgi:hypothetical protein
MKRPGQRHRRVTSVLVTLAIFALPRPALAGGPATRVVDDDGHATATDCDASTAAPATIQAAVALSPAGDTILVCPGTYQGPVMIVALDRLTLRAVEPYTADIVAPTTYSDAEPAIVQVLGSELVSIRGFRILARSVQPCQQSSSGAVLVHGGSAIVRGNRIQAIDPANRCSFDYGVLVRPGHAAHGTTVAYNAIVDFALAGVEVGEEASALVQANSIRYLHRDETPDHPIGAGITVRGGHARLLDNAITSGPTDGTPRLWAGIWALDHDGTGVEVSGNAIVRPERGIELTGGTAGGILVDGNRVRRTRFAIELQATHGQVVRDNDASTDNVWGLLVRADATGNRLTRNDLRGDASLDCRDDSSGTRTAGTANTWLDDRGLDAAPAGICASGP